MKRPWSRLAALVMAGALLWPCAWHVSRLVAIVRARFAFPGDFEWMEGGNVYHAWRLLHGLPLYTSPSSSFAPFPYPPLYWVAVAGVGHFFGVSYAAARCVSIASLAGASLVLAAVTVRNAPSRWAGLLLGAVALGGICAGYSVCDGAYDLARNDSMLTFLVVAAAALAGDGVLSPARALAVALSLTAAIYTKQTGLAYAVWIVAFSLARAPRGGALLATATIVATAGAFCFLQAKTGSWFGTWMLDQRHHEMDFSMWAAPLADVLRHAPFLVVLPLVLRTLARRRRLRPSTVKWVGMLSVAIASTCAVYVKKGSWANLYVPALVMAWPVTAIVIGDWLRALWAQAARALAVAWATLGAGAVLLALLEYRTAGFEPTPKQWSEVALLDETTRGLEGCVVVITRPMVAVLAGKTCEQPIFQAYQDAAFARMDDAGFAQALARSEAEWVIVTGAELDCRLPSQMEPWFLQTRTIDVSTDEAPGGCALVRSETLWKRRAQ